RVDGFQLRLGACPLPVKTGDGVTQLGQLGITFRKTYGTAARPSGGSDIFGVLLVMGADLDTLREPPIGSDRRTLPAERDGTQDRGDPLRGAQRALLGN